MNIRAVTGFLDPGWPLEAERIAQVAACLRQCREELLGAGYQVQTLRLATPPPMEWAHEVPPEERPDLARKLEAECFVNDVDYAAIGPALPEEPQGYEVLPDVLAAAEKVFTSGLIADPEGGISPSAARACARVIHEAASVSPDGFANLRFAALANVPPGAPFFPAAYHRGGPPALALATESADLAVEVLAEAPSPSLARRRLVKAIETHADALARAARRVCEDQAVRFLGIDFSLAPYPEEGRSIGKALESIGPAQTGLAGTATGAAFLADCIDEAQFPRTGFCGLLLPVLEDAVLAARVVDGSLGIGELLLYATLCGTGLDTIPLPGDASAEAMAALLIDLGALALRHNKPLTARLMPIPGKQVGDEVHFDFAYFADSRVMELPARPLGGWLGGTGIIDIGPHRSSTDHEVA